MSDGPEHGPHGTGHGGGGAHGNPLDLDACLAGMEAAVRAGWQQPDVVLDVLALAPGNSVADVGAGPGYFSIRLARAVGHGPGRVPGAARVRGEAGRAPGRRRFPQA